jgi:hypothetical protein
MKIVHSFLTPFDKGVGVLRRGILISPNKKLKFDKCQRLNQRFLIQRKHILRINGQYF